MARPSIATIGCSGEHPRHRRVHHHIGNDGRGPDIVHRDGKRIAVLHPERRRVDDEAEIRRPRLLLGGCKREISHGRALFAVGLRCKWNVQRRGIVQLFGGTTYKRFKLCMALAEPRLGCGKVGLGA